MRRNSGDQYFFYIALAGAIAIVLSLLAPGHSIYNTTDTIITFWDFVLNPSK